MKFIHTFKIKDNLWIHRDRVISYETEVARIKDNTLLVHGKFSRTTTKHIYEVARMFGFEIRNSGKGVSYYKYEQGVKCDAPAKVTLTKKIANILVEGHRKGLTELEALSEAKYTAREMEMVNKILEQNKVDFERFQLINRLSQLAII